MAALLMLCTLCFLPVHLTLASLEVDDNMPCVVKNSNTGVTVESNHLEVGVYEFICDGTWSDTYFFTARTVEAESYVRMSFRIDKSDSCRGEVHVNDVSTPDWTGNVDLCRRTVFPETFQSRRELRMRPSSGSVHSSFLVRVELESRKAEDYFAWINWSSLTSPGYPVSYPNFLNVTYTITASNLDHVVELHFVDVDLEESDRCQKDYVEVLEAHALDQTRLCRGSQTVFSRGRQVGVRFVSDGQGSGRGFKLQFRSRAPRGLPGAVVELSPVVNWLVLPCYIVIVNVIALVGIRLCRHRHRRLLSVLPFYR